MTDELIEFAVVFVREARRDPPKYLRSGLFSSRQSVAITKMGISRILQTGNPLGLNELIQLAVITSPPEAQGYAEMIALRVLLGDEREGFVDAAAGALRTSKPQPAIPTKGSLGSIQAQLQRYDLKLKELIESLDLLKSIDLEKDKIRMKFASKLEAQLFQQAREKLTDEERMKLAQLRVAFELIGGRDGIMNMGISSTQDMLEAAKRRMLQSIPRMDPELLAQAHMLGLSQQISNLALNPDTKLLASIMEMTITPIDVKLLKQVKLSQLDQALDALQEYQSLMKRTGLTQDTQAPFILELYKKIGELIRVKATSLDDIINHPDLFSGKTDRDDLLKLLQGSSETGDPLTFLSKANLVDQLMGTDLTSHAARLIGEKFRKITPEQILQNPTQCAEWLELLSQSLENLHNPSMNELSQLIQKIENIRQHPEIGEFMTVELESEQVSQLLKMIGMASSVDTLIQTGELAQQVNQNVRMKQRFGERFDDLLSSIDTKDMLLNMTETARQMGWPMNVTNLRQMGENLGMNQSEISRLIGSVFDYIKELIETQNPSFERIESLMKGTTFTDAEFDELVCKSVEHSSAGGLGALAARNLLKTSRGVPQSHQPLMEQAIGAGPGENLLKMWFMYGRDLPHWLREPVKDAAKKVAIDLGKKKASALIGSSEAGILPNGAIRPYMLGDDPDTIDIDETLSNILASGKPHDQVTTDDFIVRRLVSGRRCVVFLVDISGSMSGAPLASATLATAMLLSAFARDELGLAFFESDSHVVCEVGKPVDVDDVMDEVLDMQARGGTQMQAALQWAEDQFKEAGSQDRMLIMLTDAYIGDFARSEIHFHNMTDMSVTSVLVVPGSTYGIGNFQAIVQAADAHLVPIEDWENFPEVVSEILSRS